MNVLIFEHDVDDWFAQADFAAIPRKGESVAIYVGETDQYSYFRVTDVLWEGISTLGDAESAPQVSIRVEKASDL